MTDSRTTAAQEPRQNPLPPLSPPPPATLLRLLPSSVTAQRDLLAGGIRWLLEHLDQPARVAGECASFGSTLANLGIPPEQMEALAVLLARQLGAQVAPVARQATEHVVWQATGRLIGRWMADGARANLHEPPYWSATVVSHVRLRQDLAVLWVRTLLPYPYLPGQVAPVETAHNPYVWTSCWIGNPPGRDNLVELPVRSTNADPVSLALVGRMGVGDRLRLGPANGPLVVDPEGRDELLLLADDTGVAAMKALLVSLRQVQPRRLARLVWLVAPGEPPYDLDAVSALADRWTTVSITRTLGRTAALLAGHRPTPATEVYLAGTPARVAGLLTMLGYLRVPMEQVRHFELGAS